MQYYLVTGMTCDACRARVEKAVSALPGVSSVSVNLLTGRMVLEGGVSQEDVLTAVTRAGYGAAPAADASPAFADTESPRLFRRFLQSLCFLLVLFYLAMGHTMWQLPLPRFLSETPALSASLQALLCAVILFIHRRFFVSGFGALCRRSPNMDTLVALGSSASFLWSVWVLVRIFAATGGKTEQTPLLSQLYFESAAMIPVLITLGKTLEAKSKGKTANALRALMDLAPKTAVLMVDGEEKTVPIERLHVGDLFAVRPGERIPADGVVTEGFSAVDESALTGESLPIDKAAGDTVSSATLNRSGYLVCRASRVGADTSLGQIVKLVSDTAATKAPIAKIADKVSGVFVPVVVGISLCTLFAWLIAGTSFPTALSYAISVLVVSCPCALGLATPVSVTVGSGVGAKNGLLFKTAASLEALGKVRTVALDKTGTVTKGTPEVAFFHPFEPFSQENLLFYALAVEQKSEHPMAKAIVKCAREKGTPEGEAECFEALTGNGVRAIVNGEPVVCGSVGFLRMQKDLPQEVQDEAENAAREGCTPILIAKNGALLGIFAVADPIKEESPDAVEELKRMGVTPVLLTGDNRLTAEAIAHAARIEYVVAGVSPAEKADAVTELSKVGAVAMVGDGINDAPALTAAEVGVAIGAGTDVAIEAADAVLMNSILSDVPRAIRLSRATMQNIRQNLFWAFFYNLLCIPLAAGAYGALFGRQWHLTPAISAAAMSLSSLFVVSNSLRLNLFRRDGKGSVKKAKNPQNSTRIAEIVEKIKQKQAENEKKEKTGAMKNIEKTLWIEGMMCHHCENHVKKALESVAGVESARADYESGTATVVLTAPTEDEILKNAVREEGYSVTKIEG